MTPAMQVANEYRARCHGIAKQALQIATEELATRVPARRADRAVANMQLIAVLLDIGQATQCRHGDALDGIDQWQLGTQRIIALVDPGTGAPPRNQPGSV